MVTDELRRYVAENLDLGHHPNDIAQGLIDQGWSEIDVNRVFDEFFPPESEEPAPLLTFDLKDKTFLLLVIGGFLVAILSVIFGVYVIFSGPSDEAVTSESSQTEESDTRNTGDQEQKGSPEVSINENVYPNLTSALSCDNLPPNPGQSSLTTLEGIDANSNNIRDEIEHAFCDLYADNDELRYVQFLGAIATQKMVVAGSQNNEEALMAAVNVLEHYTSCMVGMRMSDEEDISFSRKAIAVMDTLVVNTPERVESKLNANSMLSGGIFDGVDAEPEDCIRLLDTLVKDSDKPDQTDNRGASIPPEPTDAVGDADSATDNSKPETEETTLEYNLTAPKKISNNMTLGNAETPIKLTGQAMSIDEIVTFYKSFDSSDEIGNGDLERMALTMRPYGGNSCININSTNNEPQYFVIDDEEVLRDIFYAALSGLACVGMNNSAGDIALFFISPDYVEELIGTEFDANELADLGEPTLGFSVQFPELLSNVQVSTTYIPNDDPGDFVIVKQEEPDVVAFTPFFTLNSGGGYTFRLTAGRLYNYEFKFFVSDSEYFNF